MSRFGWLLRALVVGAAVFLVAAPAVSAAGSSCKGEILVLKHERAALMQQQQALAPRIKLAQDAVDRLKAQVAADMASVQHAAQKVDQAQQAVAAAAAAEQAACKGHTGTPTCQKARMALKEAQQALAQARKDLRGAKRHVSRDEMLLNAAQQHLRRLRIQSENLGSRIAALTARIQRLRSQC